MEADFEQEKLRAQVDAAFEETLGKTAKGRIILAADALSEPLQTYRQLREEQLRMFFTDQPMMDVPSFIAGAYATVFDYSKAHAMQHEEDDEIKILDTHEELDESDEDVAAQVEKAERRLKAAKAGIRASYGLSRFQLFRAERYAHKNF